jgi:hypothetical protein
MTSKQLRIQLLLIFILGILPRLSFAQHIYGTVDWKMAAIISANDYNNGAATGDPGLTLGMHFGIAAMEFSFVKYTFEGETENNLGTTQVRIDDVQIGISARLQMNPILFSRIGILYHQIETTAENNNNNQLVFGHDGPSIGLLVGGGLEIPFSDRFSFQSSLNLETANSEISMFSLFFGLKVKLFEL